MCGLCQSEKCDVKIEYKTLFTLGRFECVTQQINDLKYILKDNTHFNYKKWDTDEGHIYFFKQMCKKCYDRVKVKINPSPPEEFKLEITILPEGEYYSPPSKILF